MVGLSTGNFRVVLLTPAAKLLDCKAGSVVLPGHDGLMGILRNHAPMLCKMGLGIMEVKEIPGREDAFFLINGGFARVSENYLTVLAYDVTTFEGMERSEAEQMVSEARSIIVGKAYIRAHMEEVDVEKAALLVKMGRLSSIFSD
jgi:F-type H+-transporting ATPase subunit epsilon